MHFVALSAPHIPSSFSISIVVLFAESAVPSDDDDMIGYDVGLRPRSQPTAAAAAETPSTVVTVASNRRSFVRSFYVRRGRGY